MSACGTSATTPGNPVRSASAGEAVVSKISAEVGAWPNLLRMIKLHVAQFLRDSSTRSEGVGVFTRPRPIAVLDVLRSPTQSSGRRLRAVPARRCRGAEETGRAQSHRYKPKLGSTLPVWRAKTHL